MDKLNLIFGLVTVLAFIFSVYTYYKKESQKVVESAKNATILERTRNLKNAVGGVMNTVDMIVQIPKKGDISVEQLQDIARVARNQIYVISKQLEIEEKHIRDWQYGKFFKSDDFQDKVEQNNINLK